MMMKKRILLVEDDPAINEMVSAYLTAEGFHITSAFDGEDAVNSVKNNDFNLIILDLMIPKLSGMDFLQMLRNDSYVPVIIVSAKDSEADKALGLGFGADDYITKPFSLVELLARIKAVIRRSTQYTEQYKKESSTPGSIIKIIDLEIDTGNYRLLKNDTEIKLTSKEWKILIFFVENQRRVLTKEQIYSAVWEDDYFGDENVINVHMSRLREKIEDDSSNPIYIKTIWGIGYKLGDSL